MQLSRCFLYLSLFLSLTYPCLSLWRGPSPLMAPINQSIQSINQRPINQTAYVTIHTHTNTHRDNYALHGILTMYGTLIDAINQSPIDQSIDQSINQPIDRPRIVLVTANTPQSYRDRYISHNLKVVEIPDQPFPQSTDQSTDQSIDQSIDRSTCAERFNKIHLWNSEILPYQSIVYLDTDVLVIHPIDRLFDCGDFCLVYSSIQHFTDSIFVVRPDQSTYRSIYQAYMRLPPINQRSHCAEESWHFFLYLFGDIEAAPLFDPSLNPSINQSKPSKLISAITNQPINQSIKRLSSSWSLNAMMYYEFFTWRLMRGKEFRNYSDSDGIPSFTLSFTGLKPFNFAPGIFFNLNWLWHMERDRQLNMTYTGFIVGWTLIGGLIGAFAIFGVRPLIGWLMRRRKSNETFASLINWIRSCLIDVFGHSAYDVDSSTNQSINPSAKASYFSLFYFWLPLLGPTWTCLVLAFTMINVNGWLLYWLIDRLTPPFMAWCIFCSIHGLLTILDLQFLRYAFHFSPQKWRKQPINQSINNSSDESHSLLNTDRSTNQSVGTSQAYNYSNQRLSSPKLSLSLIDILPMWFWEWFTFLSMRWKKFPEFVVKMFAIFPCVAAVLIAHVNVWRHLINQAYQIIDTQGAKLK